jgi:pimeloyl-ACP methyl ester carboxylesterase
MMRSSPAVAGRGPLSRARVAWSGVLAVLALLAVACSDAEPVERSATSRDRSSRSSTVPEDTEGTEESTTNGFPGDWSPPDLEWQPCADLDAECASLEVPLDWSDPEGTTIELALARIPASGERIGSLLMNPGGPGASGLELLDGGPLSDDLAERFDQVAWDPRGVGASTAVTCGDEVAEFVAIDSSPDDDAEQQALDAAAQAVSEECGAEDGELLAHLATEDVARDLEAIRLALGDEPLNYLGFSYGTHIGLQYAEFFGEHIRAMTLDGVVDPTQDLEEFLTEQALAFEESLRTGAEACAAAGEQECGVSDLIGTYEEVEARVEDEPLPGGPNGVGPAELATAATFSSYIPDGWRVLGQMLADAQEGDGAGLWGLAAEYLDIGSYGAYAGVVCTDTPRPEDAAAYEAFADRLREQASHFGGSTANEMLPCATWPAPVSGDTDPIVAAGAPPILVVGNTGDPATPLANAEEVAATLDDGHLLVVEMDGHTAYGSNRCATEVIDAYMIDLELPEPGARC